MNCRVMHVFYDVHLGASHGTLGAILAEHKKAALAKGEVAVFLNKAWTGAKLLTAGGNLLYWRSEYGRPISIEELRFLPAAFGGTKMGFSGSLESKLITAQGDKAKALARKLKAVLIA